MRRQLRAGGVKIRSLHFPVVYAIPHPLRLYIDPTRHSLVRRKLLRCLVILDVAVFLRDRFSCQYCGTRDDLTFDHVIPRSRGGRTTWENVVTACGGCNLRKGNRLPRECHMHPRTAPRQPTSWELQENGRGFPPNYLHESWRDYLYWDAELES